MIVMPSPNHGDRIGGNGVTMLVLHYTGMENAAVALERLCDPQAEVSAHYLVDEDGTIIRLVEEDRRAWHAGRSYWRGERDVNSRSIGIEIVNPGHEFGYRPFPEPQIQSLIALAREIVARHAIPAHNIVGHSDIAPMRKQDPGELFPWRRLSACGIGVWPEGSPYDGAGLEEDRALALLHAIGYDRDCPLDLTLSAFQRRFCPQALGQGLTIDTAAMLVALHDRLKQNSTV